MIAALLKVVDLRVEIDPLTGEPAGHPAASAWGASPADLAALETALRLAGEGPEREEVVVVSAGPATTAGAGEVLLREALAAGASRAVRLEIAAGASSAQVAEAVSPVVAGARYVICGDASLDRGSGAVPAFVAARLAASQALGLTSVSVAAGTLLAERRLDGGRRERLRVESPAVLSIEAGLRLRRAPLAAVIAARTASIEVIRTDGLSGLAGHGEPHPERLRPYRPPAGPLPAPAGSDPRDRVLALTGMLAPARARRVVEADPATCAAELLDFLSEHGYR
jgi:electron transfer flavoprotein beta subunit